MVVLEQNLGLYRAHYRLIHIKYANAVEGTLGWSNNFNGYLMAPLNLTILWYIYDLSVSKIQQRQSNISRL